MATYRPSTPTRRPARVLPCALTVAGSDSGGGAGIQADLKVFASLGVHGTSAITCLTAQNPEEVLGVQACSPEILRLQLEAVFAELPPAAVKTGMLYSSALVKVVADWFERHRKVPLVVDPVMVSTSGAALLQPAAVNRLCADLLPRAQLITPNLDEAAQLVGAPLQSVEDLRAAGRELRRRFGCAVLVKGGHLRGLGEAVDIFQDGRTELLLKAPFIRGASTHGTGCTYSAAVAAYLARGASLTAAVRRAKEYITRAIANQPQVAGHSVLGWAVRK